MVKVLKLEEMAEQIGPSQKETICMSSKRAAERIIEARQNHGLGFVPDEYFAGFKRELRRSIRRGSFNSCVYEMVYNALRSGNGYEIKEPLPHADSHIVLRLHKGEKGIIAEIEDQGEGIPEDLIEKLSMIKYWQFRYKDNEDNARGNGFAELKLAIDSNIINAIGFNEKRNAIYLMALF